MKIAIKSKLLNINILKDLKSTFEVVYNVEESKNLYLDGDILYIFNSPVDVSHYLRKIESAENINIKLSSLIDSLLINYNELQDKFLI